MGINKVNKKRLYFTSLVICWFALPAAFNINVLVLESEVLQLSGLVCFASLIIWVGFYAFQLSNFVELPAIFLLVLIEVVFPTKSFSMIGLFHSDQLKVFDAQCVNVSRGKRSEALIDKIPGYSEVSVSMALFKRSGCLPGQFVKVYAYKASYGYRVSHLEVVKEKGINAGSMGSE